MVQKALLRAVNLGPHNKVAMTALRDLLTRLGFGEPRSLLQSGNLVFRAARSAGASLERLVHELRALLPAPARSYVPQLAHVTPRPSGA